MSRRQVIDMLWHGQDPLRDLPQNLYAVDLQGWRSVHPILLEAIDENQPRLIIEIGVWKGGSTISMADRIKKHAYDGVVIAVDTWLGAVDHWANPALFSDLCFVDGYPALYKKFCNNVVFSEVMDYVVPLPLDSVNAAELISSKGIKADMVHLDAGHEYSSVIADLGSWWPVLNSGGIFVGDDYDPEGQSFPGVNRAFDEFFGARGLSGFFYSEGKCVIRKP